LIEAHLIEDQLHHALVQSTPVQLPVAALFTYRLAASAEIEREHSSKKTSCFIL
jgi:hypothetical protein